MTLGIREGPALSILVNRERNWPVQGPAPRGLTVVFCAELEERPVAIAYLGASVSVKLPSCPACGLVLVPEDVTTGKTELASAEGRAVLSIPTAPRPSPRTHRTRCVRVRTTARMRRAPGGHRVPVGELLDEAAELVGLRFRACV